MNNQLFPLSPLTRARILVLSCIVLLGFLNMVLMTRAHGHQSFPLERVRVFKEKDASQLYHQAAQDLIATIKHDPQALIVLPTGSTPEKLYALIVEIFAQDPTLDFSQAKFFNLDEYVGLPADHPLSYHYYMEKLFYGRLRQIDSTRAPRPENCHIPGQKPEETPAQAAKRYRLELKDAMQARPHKSIDLAILGIGGAYPVTKKGKVEVWGGHIAFNEPGALKKDYTRVVRLTEKTRKDTAYRFASLSTVLPAQASLWQTQVPKKAISMGLAEILKSQKIIVLAVGEEKSPVLKVVFNQSSTSKVPATYLKTHSNVHWYLDENAASDLPFVYRIQDFQQTDPSFQWLWRGLELLVEKNRKPISQVLPQDFALLGVSPNLQKARGMQDEHAFQLQREAFKNALDRQVKGSPLPQNKRILILSPHPDDDVISMGATLYHLIKAGNEVHVAYAVAGENGVRENDPMVIKLRHENPDLALAEAKTRVREYEAREATKRLGLSPSHCHFLRAPYYKRRGIPDQDPLCEEDMTKMKALIEEVQPDIIFFAAENDPHGAHGLASQLLARVFDLPEIQKKFPEAVFYGYRGAYNEWSLAVALEKLLIVPFNEDVLKVKLQAIQAHASQVNPLFPSFDPRSFEQRAKDRNTASGIRLHLLLDQIPSPTSPPPYAEVFKRFSLQEFVEQYH